MSFLFKFTSPAVFLCCVLTTVVGVGFIIGSALQFLVPSIDLGTATICGLLAVGITTLVVAVILATHAVVRYEQRLLIAEDDDQYDDFDTDLLSATQVESLAQQLSEAMASQAVVTGSNSYRKRRR